MNREQIDTQVADLLEKTRPEYSPRLRARAVEAVATVRPARRRFWKVALATPIVIFALALAGMFVSSERRRAAVMPPIPSGIHIKYQAKRQEFTIPKKYIEQEIAARKRSLDLTLKNHLLEMKKRLLPPEFIKESLAHTRAWIERNTEDTRKRTSAGPITTHTVQYWGTMHGMMYTDMNFAMAYDGKKTATGSALYIVPELIEQPKPEGYNSGIMIKKDPFRADNLNLPYLGVYQPGRWLFSEKAILSNKRSLPTSEERKYSWRSENQDCILRYDKSGRVMSLDLYLKTLPPQRPESVLFESYQYRNYAAVRGAIYPREVIRKRFRWGTDKSGRIINIPDFQTVYSVTSADVGPIPQSFFALSTTRTHTQIQDDRYGITYNYMDPTLSIDKASKHALTTGQGERHPARNNR